MVTFLTLFMGIEKAAAQTCNNEADFIVTVENHEVVLTAVTPNVAWTYNWSWTYSNSTTGGAAGTGLTSATIPVPPYDYNVVVELVVTTGSGTVECSALLDIKDICETNPNFSWESTGCRVCFTPSTPYSSQQNETWNFGDSSPESHLPTPCHVYSDSDTYDVYHAVVFLDPFDGKTINVWFCEKEVEVECGSSGYMVQQECCRLNVCFETNIAAESHSWDFGDGGTSTDEDPCHNYTNFSTYATPTVIVEHCWVSGTLQCEDITVDFSGDPGIYVGTTGGTTNLSVTSSINSAALFPGSSIGNAGGALNDILIHIAGELQISKNYEFTDIGFCMAPESGFLVNTNRTMSFNHDSHANRDPQCDIWRSIDVQTDTEFDGEEATIEGALYGIQTLSDDAVLRLESMHFNNFIDIFAANEVTLAIFNNNNFEGSMLGPIGNLNLSNIIPVNNYVLQGFAGIYGNGMTLSIPTSANPNTNVFHDLANGIWTDDCNTRIRRCRFVDIASNFYGPNSGSGIRFNDDIGGHLLKQWGLGATSGTATFENIENAGINVRTTGADTYIESQDNRMVNVDMGYHITDMGNLTESIITTNDIECYGGGIVYTKHNTNVSELLIEQNSIEVDATVAPGVGIILTDISGTPVAQNIDIVDNPDILLTEGTAGIYMLNFRGAFASNNMIEIPDDSGSPIPAGIALEGGGENTISCNEVTATFTPTQTIGRGIFVIESEDNIIEYNITQGTRAGLSFGEFCGDVSVISCNMMEDHGIGLFYEGSNAVTGPQDEQGNSWLGTLWAGEIGAKHEGGTLIIDQSLYSAAISTPQYPPSIVTSDTWFSDSGNPEVECPSCGTMMMMGSSEEEISESMQGLNETDFAIADGTLGEASGSEAFGWTIRKYLYNKLNTASDSSDISTFNEFLQAESGTSIGAFYEIGNNTNSLFAYSEEVSSTIAEHSAAIRASFEAIIAIDDIIAQEPSEEELASLMSQRQEYLAVIHTNSEDMYDIREQWLNNRISGAPELTSVNEGISIEGQYDDNIKELNSIYLQTVLQGSPLNPSQIEVVGEIAAQCPQEGGTATHWARAWYYAETGELLHPDCSSSESRESEKTVLNSVTKGSISIVPNPATESATINFEIPISQEKAELVITGALGNIITKRYVNTGVQSLKINVSDFPAGIYTVAIKNSTHLLGVGKFIILK